MGEECLSGGARVAAGSRGRQFRGPLRRRPVGPLLLRGRGSPLSSWDVAIAPPMRLALPGCLRPRDEGSRKKRSVRQASRKRGPPAGRAERGARS